MIKLKWVVSAAVICLMIASGAQAGTIFSNFGPGDTFGVGSYTVGGSAGNKVAASFTPVTTGVVTSIDLALTDPYAGNNPSAEILLLGDDSGSPDGGTVLDSWIQGGITSPPSIYHFASTARPTLYAGQQYWVAAVPVSGGDACGWNISSIGFGGFKLDVGSGWEVPTSARNTPAFRVNGVPLPSAAWLGLSLLGLVGIVRRHRRRA